MPPEFIDPALEMFKLGMMFLSITACVHVISMRRRGAILPYESRRPVPWGPVGCVLALLLLSIIGAQILTGDSSGGDVAIDSPKAMSTSSLITSMLGQLLIVVGFLLVVALFFKATTRDLGLASNNRERLRDVSIGAAACLVALAPVHITQQILISLFFPELMVSQQPIIKMVMAKADSMLLVVAGVATVVIAPICEEITFRLLFQGWLERWEDDRIGWRKPAAATLSADNEEPINVDIGTHPDVATFDAVKDSPNASPPLSEQVPPRNGVLGLSYGWFPILVSATVFGLVHYGYGPEPVPIFLLGLVLGYIYQRTHRILPSIVAHALFNLFTMFILWRMMYHHG